MNSTECLICYDTIKTNNCCVTECNHAFCLTCIIKASLKKKECPYCREKIFKNEEINEESELEDLLENDLEELVDENYAVEVNLEVEVFGDMEFSEIEDNNSDTDYEIENNNGDLTLIAFSEIGYVTYSYLKNIIEIEIYNYLFAKLQNSDYVYKFKNCDFELFKEIPIYFRDSPTIPRTSNMRRLPIKCNDDEKKKIYDLFFKDSKDVYNFVFSASNNEHNKKKKKNKSKKNTKEKVNKNRCFKF